MNIRKDSTYIPPEPHTTVDIDGNTCEIVSVTYGQENATTHEKDVTVVTRAQYKNVFTILETKLIVRNPNFSYNTPVFPYITNVENNEILDL